MIDFVPKKKPKIITRAKEPPHEVVMKEVHGRPLPVKVFKTLWADGANRFWGAPATKPHRRRTVGSPKPKTR
jgi:hypothetical protein